MNDLCQIRVELQFFNMDHETLQTKIKHLLKHAEIQSLPCKDINYMVKIRSLVFSSDCFSFLLILVAKAQASVN